MTTNGQFSEIRRSIPSQDDRTHRRCYAGMKGRVTLADLRKYLAELAPGVPDSEFEVNYATVVWMDDATPDEIAKDERLRALQRQRHEEWERATFDRLREKYGQGEA